MVSFIDAHRKVCEVEPICRVLSIAPPPIMLIQPERLSRPGGRLGLGVTMCLDRKHAACSRRISASTTSARSDDSCGTNGLTSPVAPLPD